jgi:hypothetical protein
MRAFHERRHNVRTRANASSTRALRRPLMGHKYSTFPADDEKITLE